MSRSVRSVLRDSGARARRLPSRIRHRLARRGATDVGGTELQYLFIITYGRSGSTLLLGLLNQIPGYLLRGENRAALRHLHAYHRTLSTERERHSRRATRRTTHPWFGIADVPARGLTDGVRRLANDTLFRPKPTTRVTGFKEIRWLQKDLEEHVAWLRQVFPGARFVINTRRLEDVLKSRWWAEGDQETNARVLRDADARMRDLALALGDAAYHVHFDDYIADPTRLRGLYDWLGEPWDEAGVRVTLSVQHSIPRRRTPTVEDGHQPS